MVHYGGSGNIQNERGVTFSEGAGHGEPVAENQRPVKLDPGKMPIPFHGVAGLEWIGPD